MKSLVKAYVSRSALRHNVRLMMEQAGGVPLCVMLKAGAYGHGMAIVSSALSGMGISFWGVACAEEALQLITLKVKEPILVVQPVVVCGSDGAMRERLEFMIQNEIRATLVNEQGLNLLAKYASGCAKNAYVHIKVDTGMGRNGCPHEDSVNFVLTALKTRGIIVEGIYSHFACAGEPDLGFAHEQLAAFQSVINSLETKKIRIPIRHMANSAGIFNLPESFMDMVRPGRSVYGYEGEYERGSEKLRPALRMVAPVLMTKTIRKGGSCGYGATFIADRETRAGLLPIGYADGYSRRLSNRGMIEACGRLVPIIGRISMDFTVIDLTDTPEVGIGTEVCVISDKRDAPNSVESIAKQLETIPHEVVTVLGNRIERFAAG